MVGGGWSLYTKRSCQGGGEVKQRVVYICLCIHFLCICLRVTGQDRTGRCLSCYFFMLEFGFSHIKLSLQKGESHMIVDEISTYPMQ